MRKITSCLIVLAAFLSVGCGGDTPESISKEIMANFGKLADILESVTDEASAKAAVPKIEAVRASMREIAGRAKNVKTNPATDKLLEDSMSKEMVGYQTRLGTAMGKIMTKPEVVKILEKALEGMENDM